MTKAAKNYLKDCYGYDDIKEVDKATAFSIIENIECEPEVGVFNEAREVWEAYCKIHSLKPSTSAAQFSQIQSRIL